MKKSTTTIETCRTELYLTLWNKGNKETFTYKVYVFTPKVPITIETAEKLVKQKHYFIPVSETDTPVDDLAWINDSIVLDIELGAHKMLRREITADEWYYSGCKVKSDAHSLVRNMHVYAVNATTYFKDSKSVIECTYHVISFRSLTSDSIKKQVVSEIDDRYVLLEMDMDNVQEEETTIYLSELQAYSIWC